MSSEPESMSMVPDWDLPESLRNRLGTHAGPQRAMLEDGHLLIILHRLPGPNDRCRKAALFWRKPDGQWQNSMDDTGLRALHCLQEVYDERLDALDEEEDNATSATEYHNVLEHLGPVLRASRGLHRALQQARDLLRTERALINLRDKAAEIERSAELLLHDAQFGLRFITAKQAESQSQSAERMAAAAHRLNVLAALFLPLTALASLFGMEIHSGLEDSPFMFIVIVILGMAAGAGLVFALMKR